MVDNLRGGNDDWHDWWDTTSGKEDLLLGWCVDSTIAATGEEEVLETLFVEKVEKETKLPYLKTDKSMNSRKGFQVFIS